MLRLSLRVAAALANIALSASPAGTAERAHRIHSELTGSFGCLNP